MRLDRRWFPFLLSGALAASVLFARPAAGGSTELKPPTKGGGKPSDSKLATESVKADIAGDHEKALRLADDAIKADSTDPWGYYNRGDALVSLKKVDDAVAAFHDAERRFPETDPWGKSVAIWGQANAFAQAGRCQEASSHYERFALFVEQLDPSAAGQGRKVAKQCVSRAPAAAPPGATPPGAAPAASPGAAPPSNP
jgi:tetratricopeptide (TPR) repeat protein